GVDVHQTSFLTNFEALAVNKEIVFDKCCRQIDKSSPYIEDLPSALKNKAVKFATKSFLDQNHNSMHEEDLLKLMEHKYLSSLAEPGEPVGVLAAQSVGEPSTQMTLNTFHLAGRGEMNVTLGIPRLQEILMTASANIKTPVMTCPLQEEKSEEDAKRLVDKLKRITVADVIESLKVTVEFEPVNASSIYKLEIKLYKLEWEKTLRTAFVRALEDAIIAHMKLLDKIKGIQDEKIDNDDGGGENGEELEDLGLDAKKRKQQVTDEMEYEDDSKEEVTEDYSSDGSGNEIDMAKDKVKLSKDDKNNVLDANDEAPDSIPTPESQTVVENLKSESQEKTTKSQAKSKKKIRNTTKKDHNYDRRIFVEAEGFNFKIHFRFNLDDPRVLLGQIAQKTAKQVYIQSNVKVDQCKQITCKDNQVIYYGKNPKDREDIPAKEKEKIPALQTSGVDFTTLWKLQDVLDVKQIYSNNIHAMLATYGVEAARETIIREITNVFKSYGISVDIRHIILIADYMTRTGGYRPMSRHGGVKESISPFSKMSFETASKFIVEAAYHNLGDDLETPSSRICLGLPVKVGTGCFDLMQKNHV
ncbi:hypothetical protein UlMin_026238, partial [Ulmus minor]